MDHSQVKQWIKGCEALKLHPYLDTTKHVTIGWGRNLDNGISSDEAELMFQNDYKRTVDELEKLDWYVMQPENIQCALINMNFNLGIEKLLEFRGMIEALKEKNYNLAATQALNSVWANQVHSRAQDIAAIIKEGT